jgi:hypothetical protein
MINQFGEMLEPADRFTNHNITGNGKCEGLKIVNYSEISSQAMSQGNDSGTVQRSTTILTGKLNHRGSNA